MASTTTPLAAWFEAQGAAFLEREDGWRQVLRAAGAGAEYQAAREGLLLADGGDRAAILIQGADSLDFLQRLTSNDTGKLVPGAMLWSAMLDGKGHWVADLLLYRLPDADDAPQVLIDLPRECAEAVATRMEMSHFTEAVSWRTLEVPRLLLVGPQATGPGDGDAAVQGEAIWLRRPDRGAPCWECLAPAAELTQLADAMLAAGAVPGGLVALDILRVEAGRPRFGTDFSPETILPAAAEWQRVSLHKGCYVGQEVVARIHTYGEAPRQLVRLRFGQHAEPLRGARLELEGRAIGTVTSWVWSPLHDEAIGLGTVRRQGAVEGQVLAAVPPHEEGADAPSAVAATVSLPPRETEPK